MNRHAKQRRLKSLSDPVLGLMIGLRMFRVEHEVKTQYSEGRSGISQRDLP
jgi:hypothetical protein